MRHNLKSSLFSESDQKAEISGEKKMNEGDIMKREIDGRIIYGRILAKGRVYVFPNQGWVGITFRNLGSNNDTIEGWEKVPESDPIWLREKVINTFLGADFDFECSGYQNRYNSDLSLERIDILDRQKIFDAVYKLIAEHIRKYGNLN